VGLSIVKLARWDGQRSDRHANDDLIMAVLNLYAVLRQLPLFDDLYLKMQAQNVAIVDLQIMETERQLLRELYAQETTPLAEAMAVSANSQMWVFALYELLRTWLQRARELLAFGATLWGQPPKKRKQLLDEELKKVRGVAADGPAVAMRRRAVRTVTLKRNRDRLQKAVERVMPLFRRLEALRVSLAKHEVAKGRGAVAFAPGYGRIDPLTGSIKWQFEFKDGMSDMLSRREIADELRHLNRGGSTVGPAA